MINESTRLDVHNVEVDEDAAVAGLCGTIHLPTGRTCLRPARHLGSCRFQPVPSEQPQRQSGVSRSPARPGTSR